MTTIAGLFRHPDDADRAIQALMSSGYTRDRINVMARDEVVRERVLAEPAMHAAEAGAGGGAIVGGLAGLLVGLGVLAIPGIGPVLATGTLASMLASTLVGAGVGAAAGGVLGALVDLGLPEEQAHVYAEGVKRGGILVTVESDPMRADGAREILRANGAVDVDSSRSKWQGAGWAGFDPKVEPSSTYPRI